MSGTYKVYFNVKNLGLYENIPGLQEVMQSELIRVYNMYADETNNGITDMLNSEFDKLYPNYHKDNKGKKWYEKTEYNQFMADGYNRLVCNKYNKDNVSPILDFYVDPEEVVFTGYLKVDRSVTIDFYMKKVGV